MKNGETLGEFNLEDLIISDNQEGELLNFTESNDDGDGNIDKNIPINQQLITLNGSDTQESDDTNIELEGSSSSSPALSTVITALGEELGLTINNEDLEKAEDKYQFLRDLLNKHTEEKVKSNLSEEEKDALEAIRTGVLPKAIAETKVNQQKYASIKDEHIQENDKLTEVLIINSFITKGLSQEEAVEMFNSIPEDKRKAKATESRNFMIEKEKQHEANLKATAKAEQETKTQKTKDDLQKVESFVMSQKEYVPGLPLTESFLKDVYKSMTTTVAKTDKGNDLNEVYAVRAKNPVEWEFRLTLLHKLGLFNEKPDFSKFQKVAETKTARGLEKLLQESSGFSQSGKSKTSSADGLGLGVFK